MEDFQVLQEVVRWSISPEAMVLGPIALIENGDQILIDANEGVIKLNVDRRTLKARKNKILKKKNNFGSGALWKFSQTVGSARFGAVTHPGAKKETKNYSDI